MSRANGARLRLEWSNGPHLLKPLKCENRLCCEFARKSVTQESRSKYEHSLVCVVYFITCSIAILVARWWRQHWPKSPTLPSSLVVALTSGLVLQSLTRGAPVKREGKASPGSNSAVGMQRRSTEVNELADADESLENASNHQFRSVTWKASKQHPRPA
jgi:hypothetical protein